MPDIPWQEAGPWALAAALVTVHSWFLTRPVIRLWRDCEADKRVLRAEHAELRTEILTLSTRLDTIENGGKK